MKSALRHSILRVAVITPRLEVAAVQSNAQALRESWTEARAEGAQVVVSPELGLTGYTCGDLFYQTTLQEAAWASLQEMASLTQEGGWFLVGLPVARDSRLYNVMALLAGGRVAGLVPKSHLPTRQEYYEARWFQSGRESRATHLTTPDGDIPWGVDLLFQAEETPELVLGVEVCEDLWAVEPPSGAQALAGATVLANGSASNEILGKASYREALVRQQSARCLAAYLYASAGPGESSTDLVFSGHSLIAENGHLLAETPRFSFASTQAIADIDLGFLQHERWRHSSYAEGASGRSFRKVTLPLGSSSINLSPLRRPLSPHPFVPGDSNRRAERCREIFSLQTTGLAKRLRHIGCQKVVLGISGGLDSTLALLVCVATFDSLGLDRQGIIAPTLPGFGTTDRTRGNAEKLVELLGATGSVISIEESVREHFRCLGHDEAVHDVTYENAQARERTQILMNLANQHGGICVGTGDLSEAALGWCTFNGDHMSMYHVNIGVPKTLVRYLIQWCAEERFEGAITETLTDIIATPITPELLPKGADGALQQLTEESIGPYELHDFFLYGLVRQGFPPTKILFYAEEAFKGQYSPKIIRQWLRVFLERFFRQQFKRSAMPDGPKVGSVALSPRGDWRMPSDAQVTTWLDELH